MADPVNLPDAAWESIDHALTDLFYSSVYYQHREQMSLAWRCAYSYHALAALYAAVQRPLPEPFRSTPLEVLAEDELRSLDAGRSGRIVESDPAVEDATPWLTE